MEFLRFALYDDWYITRYRWQSCNSFWQKKQLNIVGWYATIFQFGLTNVFRQASGKWRTEVSCICQDCERSFVLLFAMPSCRHVGWKRRRNSVLLSRLHKSFEANWHANHNEIHFKWKLGQFFVRLWISNNLHNTYALKNNQNRRSISSL